VLNHDTSKPNIIQDCSGKETLENKSPSTSKFALKPRKNFGGGYPWDGALEGVELAKFFFFGGGGKLIGNTWKEN